MAIQEQDTPIDSRISLRRPIPGSSLTNDPDSPYPWEKPPEYTELSDALTYIFELLIEPDNYVPIMDTVAKDTPLMDITQGILFKGFTEGKWNPDLLMLLAEPVCYMIMALAERADIDFVVYRGEEEDEIEDAKMFDMQITEDKLKKFKESSANKTIPKGALPPEIEKEIEEMPIPSLLENPNTETNIETEDSLMGRK